MKLESMNVEKKPKIMIIPMIDIITKLVFTEQEMSAQEFPIKAMLKEVSWVICLLDSAET